MDLQSLELKSEVLERLGQVIDPETGVDVVRMRLIEGLQVDAASGSVSYKFRPSFAAVSVGGIPAAHSFVLPTAKTEDSGTVVYVPEALQHPVADVRVVAGPQQIAPGVATLGPISAALFVMGLTPEQALAVNVAGKGIVLIVGCGHQGVRRMVERAEALFDEPLYGLVGGLHFPVSGSLAQRFLGSDRPPWKPLSIADVEEIILYLKEKGLKWVALSPHDSCERTLGAFQDAWGAGFEVVTVGQMLEVNGGELQ